jgi:pimeloyl-ACP methyl ester carboxylesterase
MGRRLIALATAMTFMLVGCGGAAQRDVGSRPSLGDAMGEMGPLPSATPGATCLTTQERAGVIRFRSDNGASIAGVVLGAGRVGVVFAHSNNTDMCDWLPYGRVLASQGYTALAIDLNGYHASQASAGVPVDPKYDEDLSASVKVLRTHGVTAVFLIGEGIGGTAAVKAATEITPSVAGVIEVSGPAETLGMDAVAAARGLKVPLLCIASDIDEFLAGTRQIADAGVGAPEHQLLIVTGVSGSGTMLLDTSLEPEATHVRAQVASFLHRHADGDTPATR